MPVVYHTDVKTARMTAVREAIDGGTGAGDIQIGTTSMALVLATIELSAQCGTVSGTTLTFDMPKSDTSADAGAPDTAAAARIRDGDGKVIVSELTVGLASGEGTEDVLLDSVTITAGQTVTITSGSITHAT